MYIRASVKNILEEPVDVRINIASTSSDPRILLQLASDPNRVVRGVAASNPNMPQEGLRKLAKDRMKYVRKRVYSNPNTPKELHSLIFDMQPSGQVSFNFVFPLDDTDNIESTCTELEPIVSEYIESEGYSYKSWEFYTAGQEPYLDENEIEFVILCEGIYDKTTAQELCENISDLIDSAGYYVEEADYDILLMENN